MGSYGKLGSYIEEVGKKSPQVGCNKLGYELLLMEEILHQLIGSLSHYLKGFNTIQTVVVWDFFHQQ